MKKRQSVEQVQVQQFDQRMRTFVEHRVSPSLAVTAVRDGDTIVARGYGWSDLEQGTNASAETVYLYCSMTKLFTATALMQLRERGLVDLDREVRAYLPDFPLHHPSGHEVTVRHLLSHSSGIANPIPVSWVAEPSKGVAFLKPPPLPGCSYRSVTIAARSSRRAVARCLGA